MKRRLFTILSALSLLLCVATVALWVRSGSAWDTLHLRTGGSFWTLESALSTLTIAHYGGWPDPPNYHYRTLNVRSMGVSPIFGTRGSRTEWEGGGFYAAYGTVCVALKPDGSVDWDSPAMPILQSFASVKFSAPFSFCAVTVPSWSVLALFSLLPLAAAAAHIGRQLIARSRYGRSLCLTCGYDLRASKERCPKCGTKVDANAPAASNITLLLLRASCSLCNLVCGTAAFLRPRPRLLLRGLCIVVLVYVSWLAMMAVHELGHVIHAHISGGQVSLVYFHLFDFSRTDLSVNPHPQFVAWGGPIWGSVLPLLAYGLISWLRLGCRKLACFFAGLCLVVNGAYVGVGWIVKAGDAGTLLRHGASPWVITVTGMLSLGIGLYLWHRLGPRFGLIPTDGVGKAVT